VDAGRHRSVINCMSLMSRMRPSCQARVACGVPLGPACSPRLMMRPTSTSSGQSKYKTAASSTSSPTVASQPSLSACSGKTHSVSAPARLSRGSHHGTHVYCSICCQALAATLTVRVAGVAIDQKLLARRRRHRVEQQLARDLVRHDGASRDVIVDELATFSTCAVLP
jgi:hypothetical protein